MVGLRDETDLLGCTAHYTCSREARVHCTDREYTFRFVLQHCLPFRSAMMDGEGPATNFYDYGVNFPAGGRNTCTLHTYVEGDGISDMS